MHQQIEKKFLKWGMITINRNWTLSYQGLDLIQWEYGPNINRLSPFKGRSYVHVISQYIHF